MGISIAALPWDREIIPRMKWFWPTEKMFFAHQSLQQILLSFYRTAGQRWVFWTGTADCCHGTQALKLGGWCDWPLSLRKEEATNICMGNLSSKDEQNEQPKLGLNHHHYQWNNQTLKVLPLKLPRSNPSNFHLITRKFQSSTHRSTTLQRCTYLGSLGPGFMGDITIGYQAGHGFINKHKAGGLTYYQLVKKQHSGAIGPVMLGPWTTSEDDLGSLLAFWLQLHAHCFIEH